MATTFNFNFAGNVITGLDNQINAIASGIADLEKQLADLRETQKQLENERQAMLTLAQAGESALQQAFNFLRLADMAGRDDMTQAFWQSMDSLRDRDTELMLPESSEPTTGEEPQPTAPTSPSPTSFDNWEDADRVIQAMEPNTVIDPTVGVIADAADADAIGPDDLDSDCKESCANAVIMPKPDWHYLTWPQLVKYAAGRGIKVKSKTRGELESELLAL